MEDKGLPSYSPLIKHWGIPENVVYLNHGSFGATPISVLERQLSIQRGCEAQAIDFFVEKLQGLIDESKNALAPFIGTSSNNFVFVHNTTEGVNTILNSFPANEGDEWLITNHNYGACVNALKHYAKLKKCGVVSAAIPYPVNNEQEIIDAIEKSVTPNTKLALIDYITSASAIIFPIREIINLLHAKGIKVIIDAAHAPGMVAFNIDELKPDFFVANCHKWICSPKGSAFMYVAPEHKQNIFPLVISHYNDSAEGTGAHWANQFMFSGTQDYSPFICVKDALEQMPVIAANNWDFIREQNHHLVYKAATKIADELGVALPAPESMIGSICNIPMPDGEKPEKSFNTNTVLKKKLLEKYKIEVPVFIFPQAPNQWLRISAQLYNSMEQYDYLLDCLKKEIRNV